jgi:ATP-dependent exoDNAse (exonuclease V) alpha subunit
MKIRNGEEIPYFKGKDVQVISRDELNTGMLLWADQILVAKNETRNNVNNTMRELLGRGEKPEDGDKVICLRNYWDCESDKNSALINGAIGYLKNSYETFEVIPAKLNWGTSKEVGLINANFISDTGEDYGSLMMDKKLILEGEYSLSNRLAYKLNKNMGTQHLVPMEFAYGYAITCHKSQGSEWSKVLVVEEKFPFNEEEHRRWLYTACTRSSEKLVLVKE